MIQYNNIRSTCIQYKCDAGVIFTGLINDKNHPIIYKLNNIIRLVREKKAYYADSTTLYVLNHRGRVWGLKISHAINNFF